MNWALEEAKKLIEKYPNKEEFVIASGVSPSGFIHIGNFREVNVGLDRRKIIK